jgi:carbonic anhydrase/acetyltransferase-like protein (isoleucine patch superfamily)
VLGSPDKVIRELTDEEVESVLSYSKNYVRYARVYRGADTSGENPFYE